MEIMIAVVALIGIAFVIAVIQIVRYERELRRMAQFLNAQEPIGNARLTTEVHSKGVVALAKAANAQLDARQRDEQLMHAKDRELRDGFAYLSHDIRTPLMGARGYLQLAQDEEDAEAGRHYIHAVDERLAALQTMLDQLFLFTRVSNESYALECHETNLADVASEVLVSFFPQFEEQGLTPQISLDDAAEEEGDTGTFASANPEEVTSGSSASKAQHSSLVWADTDALKRMLENLTLNMLRHGSGEPSVVQKGGTITFSNRIADASSLEVDLLFDRFYKGGESGSVQGSGLGLAIVAQLAESMGAQVKASIEKETGAYGKSVSEEQAYLYITLTLLQEGLVA